jgi:hypothetical protein
MALGTPTDGGAAYSAAGGGGTTVTPAYPVSIAAGDCLVLIVGMKPSTANGGTVTTPSGWTLRETLTGAGGYGTTLAADTGNTNLWIFTKNTVAGNETGNLTVTVATNNVCWGIIVRIPSGAGSFAYGSADGSRTTAPTSGTAFTTLLTNGTTAPNFKSGDMAIWAMCIPTDVLNNGFTAPTISSTGTTFGTPVELEEPDSGNGNDIGGYVAYAAATAGSSTAAPTVGVTATGTVTNVRGPIALIRVRELPSINAESGTFSYTGQDTDLAANRNINAEAGSFSYTGQDAELIKTAAPKEINAEAGTFSYTGQDATLARSLNINAEAGSFSYTGQDASLTRTRAFNAEAGSFTYTGQDAGLMRAYSFNAEAGAFTYTGQAAELARSRAFNAEAGTFAYTGQDATLTYTPAAGFNAEAGSFSITGQDATLAQTRSFNAELGTFSYTGQNATLVQDRNLNAEVGSFDYIGQQASLTRTFSLDAQAGTFTYTGEPASFNQARVLKADAGAFGEADPYVDPGYVDPYYSTNLTAALGYGRMFNAEAGSFIYVGQPATFAIQSLFPPESDVRQGVVYGPGGIFTGSLVVGGGNPIFIFDD